MYLDRKNPPKNLNQSHFRRMGVVNHVSGLFRKGCPGTLIFLPAQAGWAAISLVECQTKRKVFQVWW